MLNAKTPESSISQHSPLLSHHKTNHSVLFCVALCRNMLIMLSRGGSVSPSLSLSVTFLPSGTSGRPAGGAGESSAACWGWGLCCPPTVRRRTAASSCRCHFLFLHRHQCCSPQSLRPNPEPRNLLMETKKTLKGTVQHFIKCSLGSCHNLKSVC